MMPKIALLQQNKNGFYHTDFAGVCMLVVLKQTIHAAAMKIIVVPEASVLTYVFTAINLLI